MPGVLLAHSRFFFTLSATLPSFVSATAIEESSLTLSRVHWRIASITFSRPSTLRRIHCSCARVAAVTAESRASKMPGRLLMIAGEREPPEAEGSLESSPDSLRTTCSTMALIWASFIGRCPSGRPPTRGAGRRRGLDVEIGAVRAVDHQYPL